MSHLVNYYVVVLTLIIMTTDGKPCAAASLYQAPLSRWTVAVENQLSQGQTLFLHCKSGDDDLGQHYMQVDARFSWSFKENLWVTTLYWCYVRNPKNQQLAFEAFWPEKQDWLAYRCNYSTCIWAVRDDGVYLKNIPGMLYELVHNWEN